MPEYILGHMTCTSYLNYESLTCAFTVNVSDGRRLHLLLRLELELELHFGILFSERCSAEAVSLD